MTIPARLDDPVQMLLDVIALEETHARTREDIFLGRSHEMPGGRVFGGQVVSQVVSAAARTVPEGQFVHSLHGYFLRPGNVEHDITFGVDRIHDGRSFTRRRVQGYQNGTPIFSGILSFQGDEAGFEHHLPMPDVPGPDHFQDPSTDVPVHPQSERVMAASPIEIRHVHGHILTRQPEQKVPAQAVWMRAKRAIGDDRTLHQAALAYLSDYTIQEAPLRGAGISWAAPGLSVSSLDHAMWWHRPARVDDWLLYVQESPSAQGGRGLAVGRLYTQDGLLVATVAQEILARMVPTERAG